MSEPKEKKQITNTKKEIGIEKEKDIIRNKGNKSINDIKKFKSYDEVKKEKEEKLEKRKKLYKKLNRKTPKGQPVMKYRVENLFNKIKDKISKGVL